MADRRHALPPELERLLDSAAHRGDPDEAWAAHVAKCSRLLMTVARDVAPGHDAAMDAYAFVLERLREDDCRRLRGFVADGRSSLSRRTRRRSRRHRQPSPILLQRSP